MRSDVFVETKISHMAPLDEYMLFHLLNLSEMREGPLTFQARGL